MSDVEYYDDVETRIDAARMEGFLQIARRFQGEAWPTSIAHQKYDELDLSDRVKYDQQHFARGYFSNFYKGTLDNDTEVVVELYRMPMYNRHNKDYWERGILRFFREMTVWAELHHTNIVQFVGFISIDGQLGLISPWYPNGSLVDHLEMHPDVSKPDLMLDVAEGTEYLHVEAKVIHVDLKGMNVLVNNHGIACLTGFKFSEQIGDVTRRTGFTEGGPIRGTMYRMAPEVLGGSRPDSRSDVYSCAGVFLEICSGKIPFYYLTMKRAVRSIATDTIPQRSEYPELSGKDSWWRLFCRCWDPDAKTRPTITDVVQELYHILGLLPRVNISDPIRPSRATQETSEAADETLIRVITNITGMNTLQHEASIIATATSTSSTEDLADSSVDNDISPLVTLTSNYRIASGGFGEMFLGTHTDLGKVAMKRPHNFFNEASLRRFLREVGLWRMMSHRYILPCLGTCKIGPDVYMVSPFIESGDLMSCIQRGVSLDRSRLLYEVAEALAHLHHRGIVHGDVKAQNILVADDGSALLCDFGLAKAFDTMETSTDAKGAGSMRWMPPEMFHGAGRSMATDVYSFGITIAEVLSGFLPFHHLHESVAVMVHILTQNGRPAKEPATSPEGKSYSILWETAEKCWVTEAKARPYMAQVLGMLFPLNREHT